MSSVGTPTENHFNHHHLLPSKRKLEDFDSSIAMNSTSNSCKGKSVINYGTPTTVENSGGESSQSSDCSSGIGGGGGGGNGAAIPSAELQFFVRNFSGGKTLVLRANYEDTVQKVHQMIEKVTGIPVIEQGLIYRGKQLQWEQTLRHCGVQNDAGLQLVGRMRSTHHPKAWQCINDMISVIFRICRKELPCYDGRLDGVKKSLLLFIGQGRSEMKHGKTNKKKVNVGGGGGGGDVDDDDDDKDDHGVEGESIDAMDKCKIFMDACGPQGLVMLYVSKEKCNQECADECIRSFVSFVKNSEGKGKGYCIKVVLELCKLLRMMVAGDDPLYLHCRSSLGSMLEKVEVRSRRERLVGRNEEFEGEKDGVVIGDMLPFLNEVGERLVKDLTVNVELDDSIGPLNRDVCDFSAFLQPVLRFIDKELKQAAGRVKAKGKTGPLADEVGCLSSLFNDILCWIDKSLKKMELYVAMKSKKDGEVSRSAWSQYIAILKELHSISLLYPGSEDHFWSTMRQNKAAVCDLIVRYAKRSVDNSWILKHKEVLDFPARRHLAMLLFPDVREDYDELHEMLIDRSNLLAESFEYISNAQSSSLHAGLFMEFKNEEATGPGVLREWFCLVCQAIFDPQNALFVSCPLDRRRFFPSPASKVHALHLRYFEFSGRVIALALMHKIQVGVVLDRVFFLQLAGRHVSIDDIHDADPCLYKSCKQILEMDADFVDSDGLGLTFITDVEELGTMKAVELCSGGKGIAVNSKNRKEYVDLIVQHHFVTSIKEQVSHFAKGFADILSDGKYRETFFDSLELEDLDWMLHGSGNEICVEDWMSHTEYHGYKQSDPQIVWFWEVVRKLNAEQKKTLLFFWTSVKYLPVEGFRGLASRLYIYKSLDPPDNLPSSHTCFYRICIPQYPSKAVMRKRLLLITQEHVGCSFGTW